jgi:hypothetical protein
MFPFARSPLDLASQSSMDSSASQINVLAVNEPRDTARAGRVIIDFVERPLAQGAFAARENSEM